MDENQTQTTPTNNTEVSETTQTINNDTPVITTDSIPIEVPHEAPERPTNVVDTLPNKDDNGASIPVESQVEKAPEIIETPASTPVKSNNFSSGRSPATEIPNFAPIDQTISTTDSTSFVVVTPQDLRPTDMPSETQNASQEAFTTPSNECYNGVAIQLGFPSYRSYTPFTF